MSASKDRKRLGQLLEEIPDIVRVAQARSRLWRGLVHQARRRCGKPNCRCAEGHLHESTVLADRSGAKQRNFTLPRALLARFRRMTEDYRTVRRARARFVKITRDMLLLFDRLEEARRQEAVRRHGDELPPSRGKKPSS